MRLTVLDLTRLLPGGYATSLLLKMGARVVKVERPGEGDYLRDFPFPLADGMSVYFHAINRGKESVQIDLQSHPERLLKLAQHADVLIEGFRPGTMERFGLSYGEVAARNPMIIYASLSGYGQHGPRMRHPGHDINYVGLSGLLDISRGSDGKPAIPALQVADVAAGSLMAVNRILRAVIERSERGQGQYLDIGMLPGMSSLLSFTAAPALLSRKPVQWSDLLLSGQVACYNVYPTKDGRWMSVGNLEEKFWIVFCQTLGRMDWIPKQLDRTSTFREEIAALFQNRTQREWTEIFSGQETCIEPVLTISEAADAGLFECPDGAAPRRGEHTASVFEEFGISANMPPEVK
jgi:crotonobetainyl-CoA:carnitine CoA-transferase CaiB-like acyl-CoA transferase